VTSGKLPGRKQADWLVAASSATWTADNLLFVFFIFSIFLFLGDGSCAIQGRTKEGGWGGRAWRGTLHTVWGGHAVSGTCMRRTYSEGGRPLKTKCYTYVSMQDLKKRVLCRVSMYLHIVVRPSAAH